MEQALGDLAPASGSAAHAQPGGPRGHLPARRVGYQWLSTPAAVDAYLKGARHRPGRTPQRRPPAAPTPEHQVLAEPVT